MEWLEECHIVKYLHLTNYIDGHSNFLRALKRNVKGIEVARFTLIKINFTLSKIFELSLAYARKLKEMYTDFILFFKILLKE